MQDLGAVWEEYKKAVRSGGDATALYRERVWPALLERWRHEPLVHPYQQEFAVSIHTLGTSPEATVLAILGTRAKEVYVLHTDMTKDHIGWLRKETDKDIYPLRIEKSDVTAIYRHVKDLLERFPNVPVALDLTSGTKAMSAGLAAAGFFFQRFYPEVRVVYVDSDEYDPELRRPRAGTEKLIVLPNPHEVLAEVDALFASELYGKGAFAKAEEIFGRMVGKTGNQGYRLYSLLSGMYASWYALDLPEAVKKGRKLLDHLREDVWLKHPLNRHRKTLEGQVALLEGGNGFLSRQDLGEASGVLGVVETLLYLSERAKEASLALASLYAYRALELLLQERLFSQLSRRADKPELSEEEEEALRQELASILRVSPEEVRLSPKLGLLDLVAFLRAKGDPVLTGLKLNELQGLAGVLKARNESLLIHGLRVPSKNELGQIQRLAETLLSDLRSRVGERVPVEPLELQIKVL